MGALIDAIYQRKLEDERTRSHIVWPSPEARFLVWFCTTILGFMPWSAQAAALEAAETEPRLSISSGRRIGKSRLIAARALAAYCQESDATVILIAPTERQIVEIVWQDVISLFHNSGRCLSCRLRNPTGPRPCPHSAVIDGDLSASVRTGLRAGERRLFGMSPRNAEHVRGIAGAHQTYLLDEGSAIGDDVFEQCDGNTAGGGQIVATGQPSNPVGWFARTFDAEPRWKHIHISSLESPNIRLRRTVVPNLATEEWAARKLEEWGVDHPVYRCEVLGEMPSQDARRLLTEVEYAAAIDRHATMPDDGEPLVFGLDPASGAEGGDASTISMRRAWKLWPILSFHGGVDRIVAELSELIRRHRKSPGETVHVNFDAEGAYGAALRVALNEMRRRDDFLRPLPLESGRGGPADAHLLRRAGVYGRRDLYWWCAMQRLKTVAGLVHDEELREEILFASWEADQTRGSRLPDKRAYRKFFGRSPDKGDATIYCLWNGELPAMSNFAEDAVRARSKAIHEAAWSLEDGGRPEHNPFDEQAAWQGGGGAYDPFNPMGGA